MSLPVSEDVNRRALNKAREQAWQQATMAVARFKLKPENRNWTALANNLGFAIPELWTQRPCTLETVQQFSLWWQESVEQRINLDIQNTVRPTIKVEADASTFGEITLFPEQEGTFRAIREALFIKKTHVAAMNDGTMGSGKTFLAGALIAECVRAKRHVPPGPLALMGQMPYRYLVVTRKNVVAQYKKVLRRMGLGPLLDSMQIVVTAYSQLSAQFGKIFIKEVYDPFTDKTTDEFNEAVAPFLVIWDECHGLNNPNTKQTKFCLAMNKLKNPPRQVFMSATPFVTVNHARTFVLAARVPYMGATITEETFPTFAGTLAKRPDRPNKAAIKRLREVLGAYIFPFPKIKWPHKAINQVLIVDFETPEDQETYKKAFEVYQNKKRQAGENTKYGRFEEFVAMGQFRKAAEPLRAPALIRQTMQHMRDGDCAVLLGCSFRETVQRLAYGLIKAGLTRDDISIIWGGQRQWKNDIILSDDELEDLMRRSMRGEELEDDEIRAMRETIDYKTDRIMANETAEEQAQRVARQHELGLAGSQSAEQRQAEIDKFQSGRAKVCIFTLAAGGVGLSLDHCEPHLLPRVGYFTPVYSGPEAQQALGRAVRRATLSDTHQFLVYMRGTIEESHVAPMMDSKLKCIAQFTGNFFNLMTLDGPTHVGTVSIRSAQQAAQDAESEDSQLTGEVLGEDNQEDE